MDRLCEILRRALDEADWDPSVLSEELRRHLESCPHCAAEVAAQRRLEKLLGEALPTEDPELERRVLRRVAPGPGRRSAALLPAAAGAALLVVGSSLLGGVPGAGLASLLPRLSLGTGITAAGGLNGVAQAAGMVATAIHNVVPGAVPVAAGAVSLVGATLLVAGVRHLGRSRA
ncbi:MAG TPA: hypothetical protein ENK19_04345 [Acidobacteria bacterium]|nr:hypothetical protein [Acidobacteriota bacterium]